MGGAPVPALCGLGVGEGGVNRRMRRGHPVLPCTGLAWEGARRK